MNITVYDVFELNRVLHKLIEQQSSYDIKTAFEIYNLMKWLDETESFIFDRMRKMFSNDTINTDDPLQMAFLNSQIPFTETHLKTKDLLETNGKVEVDIDDIAILEKILNETES